MAQTKSKQDKDTESQKVCTVNGIEVPQSLFMERGGSMLIRFGGLLYLANEMGTFRCETRDVSKDDSGEIIFECKGYIIPNERYLISRGFTLDYPLLQMFTQPVVMHGTASRENLTNKMIIPFRYVMAETRSIVRCLRILTGCSFTAVDELDGDNSADVESTLKQLKDSGAVVGRTAMDMLNDTGKKLSREQYMTTLSDLRKNNAGAKEIINSYLDSKNAVVVNNLKFAELQELYELCKGFIKDVS